MIRSVQSVFGQAAAAGSLAVTLLQPTTVGYTLTVCLRFSPLTGTPEVTDNFANRYLRTGAGINGSIATALFTVHLERAGAGHTITAVAQGGAQSLEMAVAELAIRDAAPANQFGEMWLAEQRGIRKLLRRLVKAQRG